MSPLVWQPVMDTYRGRPGKLAQVEANHAAWERLKAMGTPPPSYECNHVRAVGQAVADAGGTIEDAEDLLAVWARVTVDNSNRADRIRADVAASRDREQHNPDSDRKDTPA